jgi:hypothetical protein
VDCDVIFELDDFGERVSGPLDRFKLVQMFSHAHYMPRDWVPGDFSTTKAEFTRPSAALTIASGIPPATCLHGPQGGSGTAKNRVAPGFAWAARRELFEQHRIHDACIVGGAVSAFASAA